MEGAHDTITRTVLTWPGTSAVTGSRGEWSFRIDKRELGHLHGDRILHIGFPKSTWHELYDAGRIDYHSVFPGKPGWAARDIATQTDVDDVIALLRINYDRVVAAHPIQAD